MPNLTNSQRNLLSLANQLSQNLIFDTGNVNKDVSIDLPGVGVDASVDVGFDTGTGQEPNPTPPSCPAPQTLKEVLRCLLNEQVEVTTPFGPVSGTLIAVKEDYIVLVEADGSQVLVRMDKIELVSEV